MADNQDKLSASDQKALQALEQKLASEDATKDSQKKTETKHQRTEKKPAADSQHVKTQSAAAQISSPSQSSTSQKPVKKSNTVKTAALWFFTWINLILLIALGGAAYWTWLQWQTYQQQQSSTLNSQASEVAQQQRQIEQSIAANQLVKDDLIEQNLSLQNSLQALQQDLAVALAQVQSNKRNLDDVSGRRPADWLLAEADYLVRMAGRKLWLEHDVKTAAMMLQSADSRIQDLADPSLLPVRALLAEDIQRLSQINQFSVTNIALSLGVLIKQVDNLPLSFFQVPETAKTNQELTESVDDWRSNLAKNWQEFKNNFFSFKKVTSEIKPFMSDKQQWLSKQQLQFALLQAQAAALQDSPSLYKQSLQNANGFLLEYFDAQTEQVQSFNQALMELQALDFTRQYPEQFSVSAALEDVIETRLSNRFGNGSN